MCVNAVGIEPTTPGLKVRCYFLLSFASINYFIQTKILLFLRHPYLGILVFQYTIRSLLFLISSITIPNIKLQNISYQFPCYFLFRKWGDRRDLNPYVLEPQSSALPIKLRPQRCTRGSNPQLPDRQSGELPFVLLHQMGE